MRRHKSTLRDKDVREHTAKLLQANLRLPDYKKTPSSVVIDVLLVAASWMMSIHAACHKLRDAPSDDTLLKALRAMLPEQAELQRRINRTLAATLPRILKKRKRRQRLAIDLTLIPYHGQHQLREEEVYRSLAKSGTSHFHAYATIYLVLHGQRYTIAVTVVEKNEKMEDVVKRLLQQSARVGIRPKLVLLDRGFYSVGVIRYLQAARYPFLMPAIARGRKPAKGQPATGIRAFQLQKRSGWGKHTLVDVKKKRQATVRICVHCGNYQGKWKRHGRFAWVYAFWGLRPATTRWVADTYRLRFGIESSYRQMNQARARTCSRCPMLRLLFVALALILRNVWVWYHWEVLYSPRRGRRRLRLERMRLRTMLGWLIRVIEAIFGTRGETATEAVLQP